jgi:hypothetical protein
VAITTQPKDFEIVWIEIGRPVSKYLRNNILLNQEMFPNLKRTLVVDRPYSLENCDVNIVRSRVEDRYRDFKVDLFKKTPNIAQQDFWLGTSYRFFALLDYVQSFQVDSLVHLESDSILLNNGNISQLLFDESWKLAYPMQAEGIGCASIFMVRNADSLEDLCRFMIKEVKSGFVDDMTLLGRYAVQNQSVRRLPTSFHTKSNFIYDAQSVGRFYLGTDARNSRIPFSTRGLIDARKGSISDELREMKLRFKQENSREIVLGSNRGESVLVNLHIHSKRVPRTSRKLVKMIQRDIDSKRSILWRIGHFDSYIFAERLLDFVSRRIFLLKSLKGKRLR